MADANITFFPVDNGDTVLIKLSDKSSIIIDCNIRCDSHDEEEESCYDVHSHLLDELQRDDKDRPYADAFILTHPDQDHCRGFQTSFHTGDPDTYKKKEDEPEKIIMGEIWFSRRIFSNYEDPLTEDAKAFKKEVERRIKLYKNKDSRRNVQGNRLRVIGYGESEETKGLDEITTAPGNSINLINGSAKKDFSFFVHAPFKRDVDSDVCKRNNTSIVLQANFKVDNTERASLILLGGDAHWDVWRAIQRRSKKESLEWDLLLSPHHCSWTFFNNTPYAENKTPQKSSLDVLEHHRTGAFVVASSKPIKDDDCNPPHYPAKQEYVKVVGNKNFFCVGEIPSEKKPEPLIFKMTSNGPVRDSSSTPSRVRSASAVQSTLRSPRTYGHK
jgi:hypothetical protein